MRAPNLLRSRVATLGRKRGARQLASVPHLRDIRRRDPRHDGHHVVPPRDETGGEDACARRPVRVGVSTGPLPEQRFTVSFYLTAMLFIVFDIEIVFLYPLAVVLDQLAWFGLAELLVFIGILALGYVYVWRKEALEWR